MSNIIIIIIITAIIIWNELVEKVNIDFDENRKFFWVFDGGKKRHKRKISLTKE